MQIPRLSANRSHLLRIAAILALTWLCLSPVVSNDYVTFDDVKYVVYNPAVKSLSRESIASMFTTFSGQQYHYVPLTLLSYALEFHFHDLAPRAYHANNLFLHLLNTALCYWLVLRLFADGRLAAVAALLFGIHPMHVESVAWVAERKDLLYSLFYLTGLIGYVRYVDTGRKRLLVMTFVLFVLSLLSKPMAVSFPLILFIVDYQRKRRLNAAMFLEKLPFFLGSAAICFITLLPKDFPVVEFEKGYSWFERFLMASYNFNQYVFKALLPQGLSAYHPLPSHVNGVLAMPFLVAPLAALLIVAGVFVLARRNARIAFGALFFLASIALVLNFFPLGNILMAEHYTYLAYIGIFVVFSEVFFGALESPRFSASFKKLLIGAAVVWLILLGFKSYKRTFVWSNSETLWSDVIVQYPNDAFARYNLADQYMRQMRLMRAIEQYDAALAADPRYFAAHNNRANMYVAMGRYDEAQADYLRSIEINPDYELPYRNLARLYESLGRHEEARRILEQFARRR
jgi:tetratricopeptide (TPR) repeat protein